MLFVSWHFGVFFLFLSYLSKMRSIFMLFNIPLEIKVFTIVKKLVCFAKSFFIDIYFLFFHLTYFMQFLLYFSYEYERSLSNQIVNCVYYKD